MTQDQRDAELYGDMIANPIIRDMWPSSSRGQMADMFRDAFLAGLHAERSKAKALAEAFTNLLNEFGVPAFKDSRLSYSEWQVGNKELKEAKEALAAYQGESSG